MVKCMNCILDNKLFVAFMTIITLYALFADDIRILACPWYLDEVFYGLTIFAFVCFAFELILACLAQDNYLCGFYFWLDFVATISLISDIGWIWNPLVGIEEIENASQSSSNTSSI